MSIPRRLPVACALLALLLARPVQSAVHIVQKVNAQGMATQVELWVEGKKMRTEIASPAMGGGKMAMIIDGERRKMITLMPGQKSYMEMSLDDMLSRAKAMQGASSGEVKAVKTGKTETINGWKCEELKVTQGTDIDLSVWLTKDVKVDPKEWLAFNRDFQTNDPLSQALDPSKVDGFPVKATGRVKQGGQSSEMTMEVVSVDDKAPPADSFAPPAGYQKMEMPGGNPFGGGPPAK